MDWRAGLSVSIRILYPPESVDVHDHEGYDLTFAVGVKLVIEPNGLGCREHLTILEGSIKVTSADESQRLTTGDTGRYFAAHPNWIESLGGPARAILIVQNS